MHGDIGDVGAKFNQSDAELPLLLVQAGERGGNWRGNDRLHAEVRGADDRVDVP